MSASLDRQRRRALARRALGDAPTPAAALLKVQSLAELIRGGTLPASPTRVRQELLAVLDGDVATYSAARAVAMASRLLNELDELGAPPPPPTGAHTWENPRLTVEQRLRWLELDFGVEAARKLGWSISPGDWHDGTSPRVRWLLAQAVETLGAVDPLAAARRWFARPPTPEVVTRI